MGAERNENKTNKQQMKNINLSIFLIFDGKMAIKKPSIKRINPIAIIRSLINYDLIGLPSDNDPMWERVKSIKVREQEVTLKTTEG